MSLSEQNRLNSSENILEQLTANITLKTEDIPRRPITLPPIFTELSEIDVYTEMARLDLQYDDLKTDKPRTASLARLCKALCIGRYIALGNQPPLQYHYHFFHLQNHQFQFLQHQGRFQYQ